MLASQIIDNGFHDSKNMVGGFDNLPSPHSLIGVTKRYLNIDFKTDKKNIRQSFSNMKPGQEFSQDQIEYACEDVQYLIDIYDAQQHYIQERGLDKIIKLENTLTPVLIKMEFRGCLIDKNRHKENIKNWKKELKKIENELDLCIVDLSKNYPTLQGGKYTNQRRSESVTQLDMFGGGGYVVENLNLYNVNYSSSKQIEDLFDRVGAPKPTDDNGKISFGENPINTYITNNPDSPLKNFVEVLLKYREYDKLLGTYGQKIFDILDNGRIRTNYGQCFTDTGRLNSAEILKKELGTNLANIPKRADIRSIFIPDPGYSFVDCDLTGQELLLAGDFSKEPLILKAFRDGFDHHSFLASISYSIIFNKKIEIKNENIEIEIDGFKYNLKTLRDEHKSCIFAKIYLGGAKRVQNVLNKYLVNHWPPELRFEKANEISKALDKTLPILNKYLKSKVDEVKKNGYVVANKLGRRRYFDIPDEAYGEAANMPIQASGADSIKIALIKIDNWIDETAKKLNIKPEQFGWLTMTVYDQNLVCLNDKYLEYANEIPKIMSDSITYFLTKLKGSSDMKIKKYWSK